MKKSHKLSLLRWLLIILFLFFFSCAGGQEPAEEETEFPDGIESVNQDNVFVEPNTGMRMIKNEFLVKFVDFIDKEEVDRVLNQVHAKVLGGIKEIEIYHVRVQDVPENEEIWMTVASLLQEGMIEFVSPIYQIGPHKIPDSDPIWDIWDTDNPDGNNWALELINAPEGWDYTIGSSDVTIGVIDFGFDAAHEDLIMNIGSWYDDIDGSSLHIDHGTMVSSIIAAEGNNNIGMTGVMWEANLLLFECSTWSHSLFYNSTRSRDIPV
jgi:hypothetical protein